MQCPSCRAVYSNGLSLCPRCKTPASNPSSESETKIVETTPEDIQAATAAAENAEAPAPVIASTNSTLIEFPGVSRLSRPQWRKELSERVREIQERRSRDAAQEAEEVARRITEQPATAEAGAPQLGLVPQPDVPEVNPIVAAALKRLERARQPPPPMPRPRASLRGGTAAATARVAEEQYETEEIKPVTVQASAPAPVLTPPPPTNIEPAPSQPKTSEAPRERPLAIVPAQPKAKVVVPTTKPLPQRAVSATLKEEQAAMPEPKEPEASADAEFYDDRAPVVSRIAGSLLDLLVIAFASSPFAAIIELTNGNWSDWRVAASMGGIVLVVMFLYLTAATALAGRTWGMKLFSLRPVDAETGLPPTTKQAVGRALLYILSLITLGLGLLYALFDVEGRTAH